MAHRREQRRLMGFAASSFNEAGFTLIEVLVSVALLAVVALGAAQLVAISTNANFEARGQTSTALLATQKMEQLRGLTWGFDDPRTGVGLPVSDITTDVSTDPAGGSGTGLNASPAGTLDVNTPGFVDYLDANGTWVGTGPAPVAGTHYVRRWAIEPLPTNPHNTLVLQVRATTLHRDLRRTSAAQGRAPGDTWLVSVKTRKAH
jgi:prepilin-type N-terminal cleavage/methylation domain-containing protein